MGHHAVPMTDDELHIHAYPGAIVATPFFPPGLSVAFDSPTPDLVAIRTERNHPGRICMEILAARRRFGWRPLIYAHYGEAVEVGANRRNIDCLFSFAPTDGHNWQHEIYHRNRWYAQFMGREAAGPGSLRAAPKRRFCAFVYSSFVYSSGSGWQSHVRNAFVRKLMRVRRVDCPGPVFNNCDPLPPYGAPE